MIPSKIYLKGFMSYRDETVIPFDGAQLWVLAGPNGAGKTAVFDAITFALYGKYRDKEQHAIDLINHQCDSLSVKFDFLLDGMKYRVQRTVSRKGRSTREALRLVTSEDGSSIHEEPISRTDYDDGFEQ